jgi:hypothetical protein
MINDLDETIKQVLVQKMPLNLSEVDVSFDAPNRTWSGSISKPTINIFLHDIRENLTLKQSAEYTYERDSKGRVIKSKLGQRYDLSYLVTAWTNNVEDEHRLLWFIMATLVRFPVIPEDLLQGVLKNQPYAVPVSVARPEGILKNAADVWTALDNQLKPVVPVVVTLALEAEMLATLSQVRSKFISVYPPYLEPKAIARGQTTLEVNGEVITPEMTELMQIGGYVTDASNAGKPVKGAAVVLVEQGLDSQTDREGRFSFSRVNASSKITFLVVAPGYVTVRKTMAIPADNYDIALEPEAEAVVSH